MSGWVSTRSFVAPAIALAIVSACTEPPAKTTPPAVVRDAVSEAKLTTVTLTRDAVRRLGIETVVVESAVVTPTRTVGGEVVVPPGQALTVAAPVAGTVLAPADAGIPAAGTRVAAGQPLMQLVALPPDRDILRTQQDLAVAEARLRQAQAEADRVAALYADRLVAARDQERAQADLTAARAAYEGAVNQQRLMRGGARRDASGLSALVIPAPAGGVIRTVNVAAGQSVAAGAPLAEVMRLDRLWIRVPLYAGDIGRVGRGAAATVQGLGGSQAGPGAAMGLRAVPVAAPPSADPAAASVDVFYEIHGSTLRPGERVSVTLPLSTGVERALVVPLAAIVRDMSGGSWVYAQTDSLTFARQRVDVVRVVGVRAVLARGPTPGTRVVTAGVAELFGTEFGSGK